MRGPRNARLGGPRALGAAALLFIPGAALTLGCRGSGAVPAYAAATGGDPALGQSVILSRHCGACHDIPGVVGAHGVVGPSLEEFGQRSFVAGLLPNTPPNLVRWIRDPQRVEPLSAMPTLGLGEAEARDVAAYLYTLR